MSEVPEFKVTASENSSKRKWLGKSFGEWLVVVLIGFVLVALLLPAVEQAPSGGRREECRNKQKLIGLALHKYHEIHGRFPPAYIADEEGRPMHSWRVLLLPFLDHAPLYDQYRFDEPWNGPHNSQLHDQFVHAYHCPSDKRDPDSDNVRMTSYVAVVGPQTAWPGEHSIAIADVKDGTSSTLFVVEIENSGIHWMEPMDLLFDQMAPTINSKAKAGFSSRHKGGAHGLLADGSVHYFSESLLPETLRALLTIHGNEQIPDDAY